VPVATTASWWGSLCWLGGLALAVFLVSWLVANRMQVSRAAYVGVLGVVTAGLTAGYVSWSQLDATELLTTRWALGLAVAPLAGAFLILCMTRLPVVVKRRGGSLALAVVWEGLVYGVAEGVLLSALPGLMTWQAVEALAWSGAGGDVARWTLPVVASIAVIVVHHLGYWEYRNRLLVPISMGCGLMTVGYLLTASPLTPTVAHVLSHVSGLKHGVELPPHPHPSAVATAGPRRMDRVGSAR
jgi:hypothetical protein